ncbi:choice-of-anchor tandem repeat GloVer-containing protein [Bordetella sp. N]|uniref:choice-of-anchor tandem repeat GloVer-containing protein n=1 Tax=Bordetella sp. N TaxID=1746199 RepID=UPI0007106788|nr:choice-of-anchor tandem repeat GloVer-containing protein [Bordetella sp. N]ALM84379.1 hypothetical protein ASB57_16630 [Bordetella sp. N]
MRNMPFPLARSLAVPAHDRRRYAAGPFAALALTAAVAGAALPSLAHAVDAVRVTPMTSLHFYAADTEAASGGLAGWPPARYPQSPPLYNSGANGAFLYGLVGYSDVAQPRGLTRVPGMVLLQPSPNINYRIDNLWADLGIGYSNVPVYGGGTTNAIAAREVGNLVRLSDGRMIGTMAPPANSVLGFSDTGTTVRGGALFRTDFDGANGELIAATVGQLVHPTGVLVADAKDNVYGLDQGADGNGRLFRLAGDGTLAILHAFTSLGDGTPQLPNGLTLGSDGALYGILGYDRGIPGAVGTPVAPNTPTGVLYRIDPAQPSSYTVLHAFTLQEGEFPTYHPALRDASVTAAETALAFVTDGGDGWIYGTTSIGHCVVAATTSSLRYGASNPGLESAQCGKAYTGVSNWSRSPLQAYPHYDGPRPYGAVYRMRKDGTGAMQWLHVFSDTDGSNPRGPLALGKDGAIYGTTQAGGSKQSWQTYSDGPHCNLAAYCGADQVERPVRNGTLYRIVPSRIQVDAADQVVDGGFEHLHDFEKAVDGKAPIGVAAASDGNLYGATMYGGVGYTNRSGTDIAEDVYGTLFQVNLDGSVLPASVSLTVTPASGNSGTVSDLTWTTYMAKDCVASSSAQDWTGAVETSGNLTLTKPSGVYYYTLSCTSTMDGSKVSSVAVLRIDAAASTDDGNSVSYGNGGGGGGALAPLALGALGLAALWSRRRRDTRGIN